METQHHQPATSRLLLTALADFVRQTAKDYPFPSPDGAWLDCRVFLHGTPEDQEDKVFPFVIIRWVEGSVESMEDAATILRDTVALMLGVHSPRSQAEAGLLLAELLDLLRRALWKQRILARRFQLVEPLQAQIPGLQQRVHQFHMATIETVWDYVWPPKALEEAGISQLAHGGGLVDSYSREILEDHNLFNFSREQL